jgi:hypothetical protein
MRSEGFLFFLLYQSYLSFFRLHCWSSRVSPVVKSVCVTICMLFLVIVNVYVVFFSMCPNVPRVCAVRDCGAVACPPTRKFERATMLEYPLKPLWHIHFVVRSCFCFNPIVM